MHAFIFAVDSYALGEEDTVGAWDRDTTSKVATYTRGGLGGRHLQRRFRQHTCQRRPHAISKEDIWPLQWTSVGVAADLSAAFAK